MIQLKHFNLQKNISPVSGNVLRGAPRRPGRGGAKAQDREL